ncbi:nucleotide-diphosphate-sugar epimerase [Streptomyces spiroverticillatus]|uniref:Nucleotide-diphosphate-sugar epimerase n=1 Tax=Streptomyces finlayi TaxID=67296 RepID=A0A918WWL0_9ACTN|nr:NAD(P)H-binding protein [Streptomyces finlayi]GHA07151.1 nucleotide-diphosphate-sugar epimerase [Streptomyces spiroverticillatus]GHC90579.1 nucleotide-diphosphate-sugar epimerase [Streptomyces finlayi]
MTFLITGARGQIGRAVVDRLHSTGLPVRAASARPAELTVPDGVETVELVLDRPETFAAALDGVRQVFLYPNPEGIDDLIKAAVAAEVAHIVLLSSSSVLAPGAESDPLALHHSQVERALAESALTCTFLRPGAFDSNARSWARTITQSLPVQLAFPEAEFAFIHPDDVADVAVAALTGDALTGRSLALTGPESLSFRQQLAAIGDAIGREVAVERISRAEQERQMTAFMPAPMVSSLLKGWEAADGKAEPVAETTASLLGRPARTFAQWARENAGVFTS